MKPREVEVRLNHSREKKPVEIVNDAAIATRGRQGGILLPLLLLDTTDRPDISELLRVHQSFESGDVKVQWGRLPATANDDFVALFLTFIRPMELFVVLQFEVVRQGILVERALAGRGLYLAEASGRDDRLIKNPSRSKILVDIPDTGYGEIWNELFHKHLAKFYRDRGLDSANARRCATAAIQELRESCSKRLPDLHE